MPQYALALDLKNDPHLIAQYEAHHQAVWPEVIESIKSSGIVRCDIYRIENRLTMILETTPDFDFETKALTDAQNPKVQGLGKTDVGISAGHNNCTTWTKMGSHEENLFNLTSIQLLIKDINHRRHCRCTQLQFSLVHIFKYVGFGVMHIKIPL